MGIENAVGGCEHLPDGTIITYARCWSCMFGEHYETPTWHGWADEDDVDHAERTGQDVEALRGQRCACECARAEKPEPKPVVTMWNGIPVKARRGSAVVAPKPQYAHYWAAALVGQRINVVEVDLEGASARGDVLYLDDRFGFGWDKITVGAGSPRYAHREFAVEAGSFEEVSR